jgi:hypothetical protein
MSADFLYLTYVKGLFVLEIFGGKSGGDRKKFTHGWTRIRIKNRPDP